MTFNSLKFIFVFDHFVVVGALGEKYLGEGGESGSFFLIIIIIYLKFSDRYI